MSNPTEINQFVNDMNGGVFAEKISRALSDVAAGVMDNGGTGKVTLEFNIKRVGETYQVKIDHKLAHKRPTANGDQSENNTTATLMHVGVGGSMTLFPVSQVPKGQMHIADNKTGDLVDGGEKE